MTRRLLSLPLWLLLAACSRHEAPPPPWTGTWAAATQAFMPGALETYHDQTLRLIVHTSVGGSSLRVRLSNEHGTAPLVIGAARVARRSSGADVDPASDRVLTFAGQAGVTIAPGKFVHSDGVALDIPAFADLAVSLFLPGETAANTSHFLALQTSYVSAPQGDVTGSARFPVQDTIDTWPFLTAVDVVAAADAWAVAVIGDSTVDGDGSTKDANQRWPDLIARHLNAAGRPPRGVLNAGIIGNRLLRDSPAANTDFGHALGEAGVRRLARDALGQSGVRAIIVRLGVNDLGIPGSFTPAGDADSFDALTAGYLELARQAHARGVRLWVCTIAPFEGADPAGYHTAEKEMLRTRLNQWLRESREFDGIVDLDVALRDPAQPARLRAEFDSGDHLHVNDAGNRAAAMLLPESFASS